MKPRYSDIVVCIAQTLNKQYISWEECRNEATRYFKTYGKKPNYKLLKDAWKEFRKIPSSKNLSR